MEPHIYWGIGAHTLTTKIVTQRELDLKMFEFDYQVEIMATHPSKDLSFLSQLFHEINPNISIRVGDEKYSKERVPTGRKARQSVWCAPLSGTDRMNSESLSLSNFIYSVLPILAPHGEAFREINNEGDVFLRIGWWSHSNASAELFDPHLIEQLGSICLGIELNCYWLGENQEVNDQ